MILKSNGSKDFRQTPTTQLNIICHILKPKRQNKFPVLIYAPVKNGD